MVPTSVYGNEGRKSDLKVRHSDRRVTSVPRGPYIRASGQFCERPQPETAEFGRDPVQNVRLQTRGVHNRGLIRISPFAVTKVKIMRFPVVWILGFLHLTKGQTSFGNDRGLLNRRPLNQQSSPCWSGGYSDNYYDPVEEDSEGRKLLLAAGAAVGGAAVGYHLGMKHHQQPIVINNNIHNDYPPPCVVVQQSGGGGGGGGGIIGGILGHHPILSNILQGGLWNGGGGGSVANRLPPNRNNNINWNRAIRQFSRAVRPLTRGFK